VLGGLQREVRDHEPLIALSPGPDGLSIIRRLIQESPQFLKQNGHLIMEIGFDQGESVQNLVDTNVWELLEVRPDLQCIPRIVLLQKR
jgi:release factor glutamine methyltransferase